MPKSIHRPEYELLRNLIRETRTQAGVTQESLSDQLGRTQSFISDIERGVRRIDAIELRDVCRLLDTDLPSFVGELETRIEKRHFGTGSPRKGSAKHAKRR
jgi:transcriptional regulator with XRE-family HTH domain